MPDENTNPMAPGLKTSEGKLTILVILLGTMLDVAAATLHALADAGHAAPWFPSVLAVLGVSLQAVSLLGYTKGRTITKTAMLAAVDRTPKP